MEKREKLIRNVVRGIIGLMFMAFVIGSCANTGSKERKPTNCDTREEIVQRYEMVFGAALTDEQQAVKEYIFLGENMDGALMVDLERYMFENVQHVD